MKVLGTLKQIFTTAEQINQLNSLFGVDNTALMSELEKTFEQWRLKLESMPINEEDSCVKGSYYFIFEGMEWIPVKNGTVHDNGILSWLYQSHDGHTETGTSRAGRWANCDASGAPSFPFDFKEVLKLKVSDL